MRRPIAVTAPDIPLRTGTGVFGKSIPTPAYLDRIGTDAQPAADLRRRRPHLRRCVDLPERLRAVLRRRNEDYSITGGYKGETDGGLTFDASGSYGRNQIRYFMNETLNPSLGPASPTEFYLGKLVQTEFNANLDFTYKADIGMANPLFIAAGFEFRREIL